MAQKTITAIRETLVATRLTYNGYDCLFPCRTGTTTFRHLYMGGGESYDNAFDEVMHSLHVVDLWQDSFLEEWYNSKLPKVLFLRDPYDRYISAKNFMLDVRFSEEAREEVKQFLGEGGLDLFESSHISPIYQRIWELGTPTYEIFKFDDLKKLPIHRAKSKNRGKWSLPDWLDFEKLAYDKMIKTCKVCENLHLQL